MKILITGATGFIGSNLYKTLSEQNHDIFLTGKANEQKIDAEYINLDLENPNFNLLPKVDIIYHQAANNNTLSTNFQEMNKVNLSSSANLMELAYRNGCKKFIYASSTAIYGDAPAPYVENITLPNPLNVYGISKYQLDIHAMKFAKTHPKMNVIGLRYCNVYGSGEQHKGRRASMIYQIMKNIIEDENPKLFPYGQQKRDWIYIKDVVQANLLMLEYDGNNVFNCGTGTATTFNQIVDYVNAISGKTIPPIYVERELPEGYQIHTECNIDKLRNAGFEPQYTVYRGIEEFYSQQKNPAFAGF